LGTRTGRPSDAPMPLCLCETPAFTIPCSGSIAGGMAPDYLSLWRWQWFKYDWGGSGRTQINQMVSRQRGRQRWRSPSSLPPFFYSAPACAYLTTADAPNVLLVFPASVAEADHHMVQP